MNQKENVRLSLTKKVAYGSGQMGMNVLQTLLASYMLSYYTDTALINAAAIGTMLLLVRFLDGITDIVMGGIVDKTRTRIGKARPWIIISAPLMLISIVLLFGVKPGWSDSFKLVYTYLTYIFANCIVFTIIGISYNALLARMTRSLEERAACTSISMIFAVISGAVVGALVTNLQLSCGWGITSIIMGIISCIFTMIPGVSIKEVIGMDEEDPTAVKDTLPMSVQAKYVLKEKYFWICIVIGALQLLMNANSMATIAYYCNSVLGDPAFMAKMMSLGQIPAVLVLLVMPYFTNRYSKRDVMTVGCLMMIAAFVILGFAGTSRTMLLVGYGLKSMGLYPVFAGMYAFCADAADYSEYRTGVRSEGLFAASNSIGSKVGIGLGSALTGWILAWIGYDGAAAVQTETAVNGIKFAFSWLGAILCVVLLIFIRIMDVEKKLAGIRPEVQ